MINRRYLNLVFSLSLVLGSSLVQAQEDQGKESHVKEGLANSFVEIFNHGDRTQVIDYLSKNLSQARLDGFGVEGFTSAVVNRQNTYGQLESITYLPPTENTERIQVISENNQLTYILNINRTATKPYKINNFTFRPPTSSPITQPQIAPKEFAFELSGFLEHLADREAFSGAVLVARGNNILLKQSVGLANKASKVDNRIDTKFALGSMNKMFTAISILQLIEQKKLQFEDKLVQFVDGDWLPEGDVEQITVRQLLTHTSGLGNFFNEEYIQSNKELYRELTGYKPLVAATPLLFTPGSRFRYSNSGMLMLGLIIEKVSGISYYDYVQKNIYDKTGMASSGSYELDGVTPNMAMGYLKRAHSDTWVSSLYTRAIKGSPAGGGFSTVDDLYQYALALTSYQLLGQKLTEAAYSDKSLYNSASWYGYGFSVTGQPDNRIVGHGGAYLGVDARLDIHLDTGYVVVILANQSNVVRPVRRKINELLARVSA